MHKRTTLLAALHAALPNLPLQQGPGQAITAPTWHRLMSSADSIQAMKAQGMPQALEPPESIIPIMPQPHPYTVIGIDGSQVYPDRHRGFVDCCILNTGIFQVTYGQAASSVHMDAQPTVVLATQALPAELQPLFGPQVVDLLREAYELEACLHQAPTSQEHPVLTLLDGTLLFGHLEGVHATLKAHFLGRYLQALLDLAAQKSMHASYLSAARTKDLVRLVHASHNGIEAAHDAALLGSVLAPGQRTALFLGKTRISEWYQDRIKPCFFYLHTGQEIARIELPHWLTSDSKTVNTIAAICLDQAQKGNGYPVCLAHAHRQAEITAADKEVIFMVLQQHATQHNSALHVSAKQQKKDRLDI